MTAAELRKIDARYQRSAARTEQLRVERTIAIRAALAEGMRFTDLADVLGVTRARITQIAKAT